MSSWIKDLHATKVAIYGLGFISTTTTLLHLKSLQYDVFHAPALPPVAYTFFLAHPAELVDMWKAVCASITTTLTNSYPWGYFHKYLLYLTPKEHGSTDTLLVLLQCPNFYILLFTTVSCCASHLTRKTPKKSTSFILF